MVHLSILALKGNQGGRTFPFTGYLGLSKITVAGVVRTRVEDDNRLLPASRLTISIRCYEARTRFGLSKVNLLLDATQTLWAAADGLAYEDLGSSDYPFRISLPCKVAGFSTMQHPEYRVFWRLEAAIDHLPLIGLGSRQLRAYDLLLTRYDNPEPPLRSSDPSTDAFASKQQNQNPDTFLRTFQPQPSASASAAYLPPCQYRITLPSTPIGPSTSVPVSLVFHLTPSPDHPQLALHSLSVVLERRMVFYEASGAQSAPELLSGTVSTTPDPSPAASRSSFRSTTASTTHVPTPAHSPSSSIGSSTLNALGISIGRKRSASASPANVLPAKLLTATIATTEATLDSSGAAHSAQLTIELAVPPRPPPSQWPLGETTRSDLATIAFYVRVKVGVVVVQPHPSHHTHWSPTPPSASGSVSSSSAAPIVYEYELPEQEVQVVNVTEEECGLALARVTERRSRSRRASASASDQPTPAADSAAGADMPPLPKGASTIKFELDDALKGGVSAAMLNSRLKSVKASREAGSAAAGVDGPPPTVNYNCNDSSSGSSGSSAYPSLPSTASSSASAPQVTVNVQDYNHCCNTPDEPPPTRSKTPRPQTSNGTPAPAHNNHENTASPAHLIRMRRSRSGKAMCRPQSEVVSPHELDSARLHGVFLAPDWKECGRSNGSGGSGGRSINGGNGGSKSDSEAKVRAHKDWSPTSRAFNEPLPTPTPTPPPVPSKDNSPSPPPLPKKPTPSSPTRPIPPPPSLPPSPPGSVSSHGHGYGRIAQARFSPGARSSPNLLDLTRAELARGRNKQARPRGNSTVSRSGKIGFFSALLSARA